MFQGFEVRFGAVDLSKMTSHLELQGGRSPRSWLISGFVGGSGTTATSTHTGKSNKVLYDRRGKGREEFVDIYGAGRMNVWEVG